MTAPVDRARRQSRAPSWSAIHAAPPPTATSNGSSPTFPRRTTRVRGSTATTERPCGATAKHLFAPYATRNGSASSGTVKTVAPVAALRTTSELRPGACPTATALPDAGEIATATAIRKTTTQRTGWLSAPYYLRDPADRAGQHRLTRQSIGRSAHCIGVGLRQDCTPREERR